MLIFLKKQVNLWTKHHVYQKTNKTTDEAIKNAVQNCIECGIMRNYLNEYAEEVFHMAIDEWNIDDAKFYWQEEAMKKGIDKGQEEGKSSMVLELLKAKQPLSLISQVSKYSVERIAEIGRLNGIPLPN